MRNIFDFLAGVLTGAISWAICPLVFSTYEPFDTLAGLSLGQLFLSMAAFYFGYIRGFPSVVLFLIGAYTGLNAYPLSFGSEEAKLWFLLGLITTLSLMMFPLLFGMLGLAIKTIRRRKLTKNSS